eukprot:CAMPEP_0198468694 /NCGR_PEP_ID=MMETSP1456-20131121/9038_1 /TAXON_ID=1461544 ORGANISM="Unidentified sp., Strain RCC1871" /NCGR_SAMPLE_ID=MMETSP1456 /ASSEMBLY_ACC=CAM_ASM_001119 /LENGTH=165 /DNA_ID=CAMNT_0044194959 /DNA_START=164 /DNA_END=661 /DNA_ORIENTATION=-
MADDEAGTPVLVHVYDLSAGFAKDLSPLLLGKQIEAIWHTGVVFGGVEYYFGQGINRAPAGQTPFGQPNQVISMGSTFVPASIAEEVISDLARTKFSPTSYSLLKNNCNHFSTELCTVLVGKGIPDKIVRLPEDVLDSPMGFLLGPILDQLEQQLGSVGTGTEFT